jgi:hypothetical protein
VDATPSPTSNVRFAHAEVAQIEPFSLSLGREESKAFLRPRSRRLLREEREREVFRRKTCAQLAVKASSGSVHEKEKEKY